MRHLFNAANWKCYFAVPLSVMGPLTIVIAFLPLMTPLQSNNEILHEEEAWKWQLSIRNCVCMCVCVCSLSAPRWQFNISSEVSSEITWCVHMKDMTAHKHLTGSVFSLRILHCWCVGGSKATNNKSPFYRPETASFNKYISLLVRRIM